MNGSLDLHFFYFVIDIPCAWNLIKSYVHLLLSQWFIIKHRLKIQKKIFFEYISSLEIGEPNFNSAQIGIPNRLLQFLFLF